MINQRPRRNAPQFRVTSATTATLACSALALLLAAVSLGSAAHANEGRAIDRGDAVVTGFPGIRPSATPLPPGANPLDHFFIDPAGASAQVLSLRALGGPPEGQLASPGAKLRIEAGQVGQVFATALGSSKAGAPDAYLGATSVYGLHIFAPAGAGPGKPKRLQTGAPGAQWMPGMFGLEAGGGPGAIWRVDGDSGAVTLFANLPGNSGPGIGDIVFDASRDQLYASDLDTGLVYRLGPGGEVIDSYDHGMTGRPAAGLSIVVDDGRRADINDPGFDSTAPATWGFTQRERQIRALALKDGRLYYAVAAGNQVWSVGISSDGSFAGDTRLEVEVASAGGSGDVSDMLFDSTGRMYLAQRGATRASYDFSVFSEPGKSQVFRYREESPDDPTTPGRWALERDAFAIGLQPEHRFAAGGIALGYRHDEKGGLLAGTCDATLWSTGDRLRQLDVPETGEAAAFDVHGLQGNSVELVLPAHAPPSQSYFIDYDRYHGDPEKAGHVGDVEIWQPCDGPEFITPQTDAGALPPGFVPPGTIPPPVFPPEPPVEFGTNLALTKTARGDCFDFAGGYACQFDIEVRNTGPDAYFAPIVVSDHLPANPPGALMAFGGAPWACALTGPARTDCWRPNTYLAPGDAVSLPMMTWVPADYPLCHIQNIAQITWAPGGSPWNTDPADDIDDATALIPKPDCPPPAGETNLRLKKVALLEKCSSVVGNDDSHLCRYLISVTNMGPGIYEGALVLQDTPLSGTTAVFGPAQWTCVPQGDSHDCSQDDVVLLPGQSANLFAHVTVTLETAASHACRIDNEARIVFAPGGTNQNTNPADDTDSAFAMVDVAFYCPGIVQARSCPAGFRMDSGNCISNRITAPPVVPPVVRPVDPPKVCPSGMIGKYPNCRYPEPAKVCPPGTTGKFPQCVKIIDPPKVCPGGMIGKYPNCRYPEPPKVCPPGTTGKFPRCVKIIDPPKVCPKGTIGKFPNCKPKPPEVCPKGTVGKPPNCRYPDPPKVCPPGTTGKFPRCVKIIDPPKGCPSGMIGKFPNCRPKPPPQVCPKGTVGKPPMCVKQPTFPKPKKNSE